MRPLLLALALAVAPACNTVKPWLLVGDSHETVAADYGPPDAVEAHGEVESWLYRQHPTPFRVDFVAGRVVSMVYL